MTTLKIRVGPVYSRIISFLSKDVSDYLNDHLSEFVQGSIYSTLYIEGKWDGYNRYYNVSTRTFRTGLLKRVCSLLNDCGCVVVLKDERPLHTKKELSSPLIEPYEDQTLAVDCILKEKYGIIKAPVRFGKTVVAIEFARRTSLFPLLFIGQEKVPCSQILEKFKKWLPNTVSFGFCADGQVEIGDVTVCSIQTLAYALDMIIKDKELKELGLKIVEKSPADIEKRKKVAKLLHDAKVVFVDEAHHSLSKIHQKILRKIYNAEFVVGMTATLPDSLKVERSIGPVIYELTFKDAVKKGYILPAKIYWYKYTDPRNLNLGGLSFSEVYSKCITHNIYRNSIIKKAAESIASSGKTVVITVKYKEHGNVLLTEIPGSVFIYGKDSLEVRNQIIDALQRKKVRIVISTLIKEAVDIPSLDAVINAEGGKSFISTIQKLRSITPDLENKDKKAGLLIDFYDDYKYLKGHSNIRLKEYKKRGFEIIKRVIT